MQVKGGLKLFDLGETGLDYFKSSVAQADYVGLGTSEVIEKGGVHMFLPQQADPHAIDAADLRGGSLNSLDADIALIRKTLTLSLSNLAKTLDYTVLSKLQRFEASEREKAIGLYAQDPYKIIFAESTTKVHSSSGLPSFSVYGVLTPACITSDNLDIMLSDSAFSFSAFSVLTRNADIAKLNALDVVSPDFLVDVGRAADYAIVDAFDLETFVVWIREGSPSLALFTTGEK